MFRTDFGDQSYNYERLQSDLKLKLEKEKAMVERDLKNSMRLLEERLLKEKRAEIELIETGHREDSMKMMESQRISINALKTKLEDNLERQIKQLDQEHQDALELLQMRYES